MWLKLARQLVEVGYPPRSEWIDMVLFKSDEDIADDPVLEEYARDYPEDVDGDLTLRTFNLKGKRKVYEYPGQDLDVFNDVSSTGGHGFWENGLDSAPFIAT